MRTGLAVAGAALVELALLGRIAVTDGKVVVLDPAPVGEPAVDPVLGALAGRDKPRKAHDWVELLRKDAVNAARERLLDRGLVREEKKRVWGIFPTRRYPEADGTVERELRDTLAAVATGAPILTSGRRRSWGCCTVPGSRRWLSPKRRPRRSTGA